MLRKVSTEGADGPAPTNKKPPAGCPVDGLCLPLTVPNEPAAGIFAPLRKGFTQAHEGKMLSANGLQIDERFHPGA